MDKSKMKCPVCGQEGFTQTDFNSCVMFQHPAYPPQIPPAPQFEVETFVCNTPDCGYVMQFKPAGRG